MRIPRSIKIWLTCFIITFIFVSISYCGDKEIFIEKHGVMLSNSQKENKVLHLLFQKNKDWRQFVVDDAHVVKDGNKYKMLFSALGKKGLWFLGEAKANNLKGKWYFSNNDKPLLSSYGFTGGWGGGHLIASMYFIDPKDNTGKIVYQCSTGEKGNGDKIGITDKAYSNIGYELFSGESRTIGDPFLIHDGKYYHLFYSKQVNGIWQTWKRKALSLQGLKSKDSAKCIIKEGGSSSVFRYKGVWHLVCSNWYDDGNAFNQEIHKNKLYLWKSENLENWTPQLEGKPIFEPNNKYDKFGAQDPCIFIENDIIYIYYGGIVKPEHDGNTDTSICLVTIKGMF